MTATYYQTPWGVQGADLVADPFIVPDNWVEITEAAYNAQLAIIHADPEGWKAGVAAADCAARKAVYEDLSASVHTADWSEATIQAVSRYTPGEC